MLKIIHLFNNFTCHHSLMKIAILDLDIAQAKSMCEILMRGYYQCHAFTSLPEFLKQFSNDAYHLLVVSLHNAEEERRIVKEVRTKIAAPLPILSITGTHDEDKIVGTLAAGANDYLLRPLRRGELATRVSVLLRHAYPTQIGGEKYTFGSYSFESRLDRVTISGKRVEMTKKEFELALLFFRSLGQPISRSTIIDSIWKGISPELSRTVDTHISRVRAKLKLTPEHGYRLSPVYGFGYRLDELKGRDAS
jgi:DNA-binding response OmpR family regulator